MNDERAKRKLSAILSADVKGYSRLMGDNELATIETLKKNRELISSIIGQFIGRVIDSPGDNILAEFGSVVDAVECSVKIQEGLKKENKELPENRKMEFRIGVNLGDVIEDEGRIYGDGVNIAARIESLSEAGGICISRSAYDQIKGKINFKYEYLGEHQVKNIDEPVRVYKVIMGPESEKVQQEKSTREPASIERMSFPLPDKPSIAVLPFTNMSGDPSQDYIGDGISENIISALSVSSQLFVIARNSTFTYKGKPVKIQQVAEDLGVQYVLEGSIQKSRDRLRVTVQLIDALSGNHLWSEKYDREMIDLFDLQDEITKKIVISLQVELTVGEDIRVIWKSTENLEAWKHQVKGSELLWRFNREANAKAREHFKAALDICPEDVNALSSLAFTHHNDAALLWTDSPIISFTHALEIVNKALKLDDKDPAVHSMLGIIYTFQRQHEKAVNEQKLAIKLNPNFAFGYGNLAMAMFFSGQFDEAVMLMKKAIRLNPNLLPIYLIWLCGSYSFLGRYKEALEVCKIMENHFLRGDPIPEWFAPYMFSIVYQELGRVEEA